jgi:hypothetical protein
MATSADEARIVELSSRVANAYSGTPIDSQNHADLTAIACTLRDDQNRLAGLTPAGSTVIASVTVCQLVSITATKNRPRFSAEPVSPFWERD